MIQISVWPVVFCCQTMSLVPLPVMVPRFEDQKYESGSPSASVALTVTVLVWVSLMTEGVAVGPAVISGALFGGSAAAGP